MRGVRHRQIATKHHNPWTLSGHVKSLATTQKYLEPSKETEKQLEDLKLPF